MPDEQLCITPLEVNARKLVQVLLQCFPVGGTSTDLREQFEKETSLHSPQSYYAALSYCKKQGWFIGGGRGQPYKLSPDGSWKEPDIASIGASLRASRDRDQLEYLVDTQTQQIQGLRSEVERLRNWSEGDDANGSGVAIPSLIRIITDSASTTRQKLKASETILSYRVSDASVVEFTKKFLQSICTGADVATDHRVEAAGLLRRCESPRTAPETVKLSYGNDGTGATRTEAWRTYERWQLKKQIVLETHEVPPPGWDEHLKADTYVAPEGNNMPPVRVVADPVSGFRLLDNLMPKTPYRIGNGNGGDDSGASGEST